MSNNPGQPGGDDEWVKNSSLYREFLAEQEEILRHKWFESEKAGRDVGFDYALMDWITKHRSGWRRAFPTIRNFAASMPWRRAC